MNNDERKDFRNKVLAALGDAFSNVTLAECDSSGTFGQRLKENLHNKKDEHGMPVCTVMGSENTNINDNDITCNINDKIEVNVAIENIASSNNSELNNDNQINKNTSFNFSPHLIKSDLEFDLQNEKRVLEANDSVLKLGQYHWLNHDLGVSAMKDLMLISITVGGSQTLHAMLDSGASCSIINSHLLDQVGGPWHTAKTTILGIGDKNGTVPKRSEPLSVTMGGIEIKPFSFYTLPNVDTGYDVILGRDFMQEYKIELYPSIRKIRIGCKLNTGEESTFFVFQKECPEVNVDSIEDITCIDVPCYLVNDVTLVADEVDKICILPNSEYIKNKQILKNKNLIAYLEVDPQLTGYYPNMGRVYSTFDVQQVDFLVSNSIALKAGTRIGSLKTSRLDELPERVANIWRPNDASIYSIMTDQEVAEAVNSMKTADKVCNNPTAMLDDIKRFENVPMDRTPPEYQLGHHARIYPPRDMVEFERLHREWESDKIPDGIKDAWTEKRIKAEFKLPDGELDEAQRKKFYDMIFKYRVAFMRNSSDIHLNTIGEVHLQLINPDYHKLSVKPTRWSPEANRMIKGILDDYLRSGVIKHGSGPYSSRVFVVFRRANEDEAEQKPRLVIDYRNINKALVPCSKYLAGVDSLLLKVKNHRFYSKMDLKGAYHQIGIVEDKKDITSIVTVDSQFVFNVMSFGLSVAPGYFEIFMERCFKGIPDDQLLHYLDDCIVPADAVDDMLDRLEQFLYRIVKYRMKLSPSKCEWFARKISFLGFILDERGMKKSPEYVNRIREAPKPLTIHEMMKFLGLVNFQRRFVPACSEIIAPLNDAIDRKVKNIKKTYITWTPPMEEAFIKIKEELAKDVSLAFPETGPNAKPLKLFVDASKISIGSALFQEQSAELRPISYISKLLSKTELRYSAYDKEILGLVRGVLAHQQYLVGRKFIIYTDCRNIVYLYRMKNCCPRLLRLLECLSSYDFTIEHIAGIENYISDLMSRLTHFTDPEFYKKLTDHVPEDFVPDGLMEMLVKGGPESPFETIAYLLRKLRGEDHDPAMLRTQLVTELMNNPTKYDAATAPDSLKLYKSALKQGVSIYIVIFRVAAEILKMTFYIYFGLEQPLVFKPVTRPDDEYQVAFVICRGQGVHFNPLSPINKNFDIVPSELYETASESEKVMGIIGSLTSEDLKREEGGGDLGFDDQMAVIDSLTEIESGKNVGDCPSVGGCHALQSSAHMTRSIEQQLPTLYLRRYRDPYLCPNRHSLGDFCLKLSGPSRSGASGGARGLDGCHDIYQLCLGIDTGSSISLVTESAMNIITSAGFAEAPANLAEAPAEDVEIRVLNGSVLAIGYVTLTFPFWFVGDTMKGRHSFYVLRDEDLPCCILLGADYLKTIDMTIACSDDETMRYRPIDLKIRSGTGYEFHLRPMHNEISEKQKELLNIACVTTRRKQSSHSFVHPPREEEIELRAESYPFSLSEVRELQGADPEVRELKFSVSHKNKDACL